MNVNKMALVTGSAGFIGFHTAECLLKEGWSVVGIDNFSDYYDVQLKERRNDILSAFSSFKSIRADISQEHLLESVLKEFKPKLIIHLAAQAGVRQSIQTPDSYVESNIIGTFKLLEAARKFPPLHLMIASTSSVYGANNNVPYEEESRTDSPVSFYAATKKSIEVIAYSYAHLYAIPISVFRFFTVYGPWGRPDMALFKFVKLIINEEPIELYNHGDMERDFTYISDIVEAIKRLSKIPPLGEEIEFGSANERLFTKPPYRVINIGNSSPVPLLEFVNVLERALGQKAKVINLPMQMGDVYKTWSKTDRLYELTNFKPSTDLKFGVRKFVEWYRNYYKI